LNDLYLVKGVSTGRTGWQAHLGALQEAGLDGCDIQEIQLLWRTGRSLIVDHNKVFTGPQRVLMASHLMHYPNKAYIGLGWGPDTPFIGEVGRSQNEAKGKLVKALFSLSKCQHADQFSFVVLRVAPKKKGEYACGFIGVVA
jgi:hypothetical protein